MSALTPNRPKETLPSHLASRSASGLALNETVAQFELGSTKNFVYLILDWTAREAALVDCQGDFRTPLEALAGHGFRLARVLLTHTHHDHVLGLTELVELMPDLKINAHTKDAHRLASSLQASSRLELLESGEIIRVGNLEVQALHTPGHSAGELCYFLAGTVPPYLFTGDTVFIRDCGRTDFPDGSTGEMFASLQMIRKLPPETVILPGHHYQRETATTLSRELRESPPFLAESVEALEALP
jgi:hydroxyacylglutathione hydrolase